MDAAAPPAAPPATRTAARPTAPPPASSWTRRDVLGRLRAGDDHRVERCRAVPGAGRARRPRAGGRTRSSESRAWTRRSSFARWKPNSSTRRRSAASAAVGDPRAPVRAQAPVEHGEIRRRSAAALSYAVGVEPPPHERELAPVGLVEVLLGHLGRRLRQLALVAGDRLEQLVAHRRQPRGDAELGRERPHLVAVAAEQQPPRALERLGDGLRPRVRVPVGVAADPGAEAERRRRAGQPRRGSRRAAPRRRRSGSARRTSGRCGSRPRRAAAASAPRRSARAR